MVTYPEALNIAQEQAAAGTHYVVFALRLGGFTVMSAENYDVTPGTVVHPFSLAHDTRRSDEENDVLLDVACKWQRDMFENHQTETNVWEVTDVSAGA